MTLSKRAAALLLAAAAILLGLLLPATANAADSSAPRATVASTWPEDGFTAWLPPRQGRISLSSPVNAAGLSVTIAEDSGKAVEQPIRLTKGQTDTVYLKFPSLVEGQYTLQVTGTDVVTTTVHFGVGPEFTAPGGGNHRDHGTHQERDALDLLATRFILVLGAAIIVFASRRRAVLPGIVGAAAPRLGGVLLAAAGMAMAVETILATLEQYPNHPLEAVTASPVVWLHLPLVLLGGVQAVAGLRTKAAAYTALALCAFAGLSVAHGSGIAAAGSGVAGSALMALTALLIAETLDRVSAGVTGTPAPAASRLAVLAASVIALSMSLLILHAHGFEINGDFREDLHGRIIAATALAVAVAGLIAATRKPRSVTAILLSTPMGLAIVAAAAWLLWNPPPTSGL